MNTQKINHINNRCTETLEAVHTHTLCLPNR